MADVKISELPVATTVSDSDIVVINQGGTTKTAVRSLIKNPGTVTSVTAGTGLSGGTITGSGTVALEIAGESQLGGIKVGSGLSINGAGILSASLLTTSFAVDLPGDGNWLTAAPTIPIGTGDYTIEMFVNISAYDPAGADLAVFFDARGPSADSAVGPLFYVSPEAGHLKLYSNNAVAAEGTGVLPIPTSGWHHIAAVRESSAITLYIDGASVASGTDSTNWTSSQLYINAIEADTTLNATMKVGSLRVSSSARYTGATYTVPTAAFVSDVNTVYILLQDSTLDAIFTPHGTPTMVLGPLSALIYVPETRTLTAGAGLTGGGDLSADRTFAVAYGTSASTAAEGNDSRLSDSRTPTAHKASHSTGGTDALLPTDIGAAITADVQVFTSSGTWTKPANAKFVNIQLFGAGGGAGGGRKDSAAVTTKGGGGGGAGGSYLNTNVSASALSATEAVTIGSGGAGGAGVTTNGANGVTGSPGGGTLFNSFVCTGGGAGIGGITGGGVAGTAVLNANSGGASSVVGTASAGSPSQATSTTMYGGPGGGGGGGITAASVAGSGGTGGRSNVLNLAGGVAGAAGTAGTAGTANPNAAAGVFAVGSAGGGGGASIAVSGGAGGAGGFPAGGGGGGGATETGTTSGAGGPGAAGMAVITTYF